MTVLSHRGYWKEFDERNKDVAFRRSFEMGFGTETDIRDTLRDGKLTLVISHDCPAGGEITLEEVFNLVKEAQSKHGRPLPLALNIKADGLATELQRLLKLYDISDYYVFDMSFPDMTADVKAGLKCFTRLSEHEKFPPLMYSEKQIVGIWLDAYTGRWYDEALIRKLIADGKQVTIVSPDLHKRFDEFVPLLNWLVETGLNHESALSICTDKPEEAAAIVLKPAA